MTDNRKTLYEARDKSVIDFSNNVSNVINAVYQKNKRDGDIIAIKDRFSVIRKEHPELVIENAGPRIWKYRDEIKKENISFFLKNNFEEDIKDAQQQKEVAELSEFEDLPVLLNKAKAIWVSFNPAEKQVIIKLIKNLLMNYATYVSATRKLKQLDTQI